MAHNSISTLRASSSFTELLKSMGVGVRMEPLWFKDRGAVILSVRKPILMEEAEP